MKFTGSIVASITPFRNGSVDVLALEKIVEWHIANGTQGIVPCGTTGEGALLTQTEWELVISTVVKTSNKRIPVIAGCAAPSTHETVRLTARAKELGADAALIIAPYYVKPNQEGVFLHYKTISDSVDLPLIVYNNPARNCINCTVETVVRLASLKNVVAWKDSDTDISRVMAIKARAPHFPLLSGDDPSTAGYLASGGDGMISVIANVAPKLCRQLWDSWSNGDLATFKTCRDELAALNTAVSGEVNPTPIKYAASLLGLCQNEVRLPLVPVTPQTAQKIDTFFDKFELKVAV